MINGSSTNVLLLEDLLICLWDQDKWLWGNSPGRQPGEAHLRGHQQVDEVPVAGDKHFQINCRKDGVGGWTKYLKISITSSSMDGNPAQDSKRMQDWPKKNLMGVVGEGRSGLPATLIAALLTILQGASLNEGLEQLLQKNQIPDPLNQGGNGVPRQEHRGKVLQEVQVPDWGCGSFWLQFHWI